MVPEFSDYQPQGARPGGERLERNSTADPCSEEPDRLH